MATFNELGLNENILKAITELGFETPTPVQEKIIPKILESDRDIIALAQTGTGKTAAFGLPLVEKVDSESKKIAALVLCPTRELCIQISNDLQNFSKHSKKLNVVAVYGGSSIDSQIRELRQGPQIVIGTPGRTNDLIRRRKLDLSSVKWLVLDEADEMLTMGFKDELESILEKTPSERQTLLFSATMPEKIASDYMQDPEEITIGKRNTANKDVEHIYYMVHAKDRYKALKRIADMNPDIYGIIFCRTRQETKDIADTLIADGYNADALHGDLTQQQRDYVMNRYRVKNLQLLVATDVAARGIDVNNVTHVINYNLPDDVEVYTHRSGRTGRAGNKGLSLTIIHMKEMGKIRQIERIIGRPFTKGKVPTGQEICEKQLFSMIDRVEKAEMDDSMIDDYLPVIEKKLEWLSREELIKKFVSAEFNRFLDYYKNEADLNVPEFRERSRSGQDRRQKDGKRGRRSNVAFTRFYINVGSKNKLTASRLIGMINERTKIRNIEIGKIEILQKKSFFEVDAEYKSKVFKALSNVNVDGVSTIVDVVDDAPSRRRNDRSDRGPKRNYSRPKKPKSV